jgi:hypothetical protein
VLPLNDTGEGPDVRQMGAAEGTGDGHCTSTEPAHAFSAEGLEPVRSVTARLSTSGDHTMKPLRKFHPDLQACELEDRLLPVIANLGVIVLTTGGYVLMIPSLGAAAYPGGTPVGSAIPTSFSMTGSGGISSIQPGDITGIPGLAAPATAGSSGGAGVTIGVGSGAGDPAALNIPLVTRNTIANDALNPPPLIGRPSGDESPLLPAGQFYRGDVPEAAAALPSSETPGELSSRSPSERPGDSFPIRLGGDPPASRPTFREIP